MTTDHCELLFIKGSPLVEDGVRNTELADVVQES
jgi:hypothetical protein